MRRGPVRILGALLDIESADEDHLHWAERSFAEGPALRLLAGEPLARPPRRALVIGAGTGLLPLALAASFPGLHVVATEHHPDLAPLLRANVAAAPEAGRIEVLAGLPAVPGVPLPRLVRSRDAPAYRALVDPGRIEGWMEPLPCAELPVEGPFDLLLSAVPELLAAAAALLRAGGASAALLRAAAPPDRETRAALAAACPRLLIDCGEAGTLAAPATARDPGPLLDIVVPVWGVEAFVEEAVGTLLAEPDPAIRVTVVDDGSPDRSVARLRTRFGADGPRFRILAKPNGGCASARNFGMAASASPFVAFADGDDAVEPGFFSGLLAAAELSGLPIVQGPFAFRRGEAPPEASYEARDFADRPRGREGGGPSFRLPAAALLAGQPSIWRRVYRRDFLARHRLAFPEHVRAFDDQLFQLRSLMAVEEVLMREGPAYLYRQHPAQDIAQDDARHLASLGMFRDVLAEHVATGRGDAGALLAAMIHTMNWSGRRLREDLRPAFVAGAADLLSLAEKALGADFPADRLALLEEEEVRAEHAVLRARRSAWPASAAFAALGPPLASPALLAMARARGPG